MKILVVATLLTAGCALHRANTKGPMAAVVELADEWYPIVCELAAQKLQVEPLDPPPTLRIYDARTYEKKRTRALIAKQREEGADAPRRVLRKEAAEFTKWTVGQHDEGQIFINQDKLLQRRGIALRQSVQAVLAHECVHALAHARYATGEWTQTLAIVKEGHANLIEQLVCAELGCLPATDYGMPTDPIDQARYALANELKVDRYVTGQEFVRAVLDARGPEGVRQLYTDPPVDLEVIYNPQWYLDDAVVAPSVDLEGWRTAFAADNAGFNQFHVKLTPIQLRTFFMAFHAFSLPEHDLIAIDHELAGKIRDHRAVLFLDPGDPPEANEIALLLGFTDEQTARDHVDGATARLVTQETSLVVVESIEGSFWTGVWARGAAEKLTEKTVIVARDGAAVFELVLTKVVSEEDAIDRVEAAFAAMHRPRPGEYVAPELHQLNARMVRE